MLDKIKLALRIKNNAFDLDILDLVESSKIDLQMAGVKRIDEEDPIILQAIKLYCKANFGLDNKDSEKYQKSYDMLKQSLSLCGEYNVE